MRIVLQRVLSASVSVEGRMISSIQKGLLVLVGISTKDTHKDAEYICRKILGARLWASDDGKSWDISVVQKGYEILLVSQFTLYGFLKGNKPDFHNSMNAEQSKPFYQKFVQLMRERYKSELVKDGEFGAKMEVQLTNDGPVTLTVESAADDQNTDS